MNWEPPGLYGKVTVWVTALLHRERLIGFAHGNHVARRMLRSMERDLARTQKQVGKNMNTLNSVLIATKEDLLDVARASYCTWFRKKAEVMKASSKWSDLPDCLQMEIKLCDWWVAWSNHRRRGDQAPYTDGKLPGSVPSPSDVLRVRAELNELDRERRW